MPRGRKRLTQLVLVIAAFGVFYVLSRHWPKDQVVHFALGDAAPRVDELRIGYGEGNHPTEWTRSAELRYAKGRAPRIATHEPRLPDGNYTVEVEIDAAGQSATVTRHVHLEANGSTTIDLARDVPVAPRAEPGLDAGAAHDG